MQWLLLLVAAAGTHAEVYKTRFDNVTWDDKKWELSTTYADQGHYQARSSASNGYLGIALSALGPFFEVDVPVNGDQINGWPLFDRRQTFATVAGLWDSQPQTNGSNFPWLYQYSGESVISGIPHWSGIHVECHGNILQASTPYSQIKNFSSSWNFKKGLVTWDYTWVAPGCPAELELSYATFSHKLHVHKAATKLSIRASAAVNVTIHDVLNGDCAVRSQFLRKGQKGNTIHSSVTPDNLPHVEAHISSTIVGDGFDAHNWTVSTDHVLGTTNASSIAQSNTASLKKGKTLTVHKFIGGASTDAFPHARLLAHNQSLHGASIGWRKLLKSHTKEWAQVLSPESVDSFHYANGSLPQDENIVELQINAITNPFQILQNTVSANALKAANDTMALVQNGISVSGLGSDSYGGMIFWDEEIWMLPGLVVTFPEDMSTVPNYRVARYRQAKKNVLTSFTGSQNKTVFSNDSAIYSWTSGRRGQCTATGPCWDYEYHIGGDIALALEGTFLTTGDEDTFQHDYLPVYSSTASVYSDLLKQNSSTQKWELMNATDPDEFANAVNNPLFTAILMQHVLKSANQYRAQFSLSTNSQWNSKASGIEIPTSQSAGIHLEFTGMNGSIEVKQADVVLIYDLLNVQSEDRLTDLDYYAGKQSRIGPGMTYSVFSIVASKASPSGCSSYTYGLWAAEPYARAPWFQYSEQLLDTYSEANPFHPAYPFLTGMGGQTRVAIFSYLGYSLLEQDSLNVNPLLPPQIPNLRYRIFYWRGWGILASSNQTHTVLARSNVSLSTADQKYSTNIPVTLGTSSKTYSLSVGKPIVLKTRRPDLQKTIPYNIAQCASATSSSSYLPGQFPLAAIDGAASTKWQPTSAARNSTLIVELGEAGLVPITGFAFDWAQAPPVSWTVSFSNSSSNVNGTVIAGQKNVVVSEPYNAMNADAVVPYSSNTTVYNLKKPQWGGRYASLTIRGNQGGGSEGATVAEFAIVAHAGQDSVEMRRYYGQQM